MSRWIGRRPTQLGNELWQQVGFVRRKIALDMMNILILRTPVDTGRARGNWQVTTGSPAGGQVGSFDNRGALAQLRALTKIGRIKRFETIYFTNNVPYIRILDEGGPGRVAHRFTAAALAAGRSAARRVR